MVFSALFLIIIINAVKSRKTLLNMNSKLLSYLGKISYGLYMYHFMIVAIVLWACKELGIKNEFLLNFIAYFGIIGLTMLVAAISYNYFEKPFIDKKAKHSPVKSVVENIDEDVSKS